MSHDMVFKRRNPKSSSSFLPLPLRQASLFQRSTSKNPRLSYSNSTSQRISTPSNTTAEAIPQPTQEQLRNHFISNGLPMVGFGIMDQTVMIQAGNMIDCTIGVTLGLSTLTAAAVGGLISNLSGVIFGGTLEVLAKSWGLPPSNLTSAQRSLPSVKRGRLGSQAIGIFFGCCIGLMNLLFIDTDRSSSLKLLNKSEVEEFAFEVAVSNDERSDATVLTVRGPDLDGILASITAALTVNGCSLLEVNARSATNQEEDVGGDETSIIEDIFVIVDQTTKEKIKDDELENLCKIILDASREGPNLLKYKVIDLEEKNAILETRVKSLEGTLLRRRMTVKSSGKGVVRG